MIKLKQKFIIYASGLLFLLTGCIQDGFFGNNPEEGESLTFTFLIDGMTTNSTTRAAISPVDGETSVESLHLLFFEAKDNQSGTLVKAVSLPDVVGTTGKLTMETSYVLPTEGDYNASGAYHIIGIANLGKYVDNVGEWLGQWTGVTEAFFRDNATVEVDGTDSETADTDDRPFNLGELLMNGYVDKPSSTKNIQMVLSRNLARFDVVNNATSTHSMKTVSIWNAFTKSSITGDAIFNYTSEGLHTKRFYGINTDGDKVTGGLYAFANYSETPGINDKTTTCLIVGLDQHPTRAGSTRYYRINVHAAGSPQLLKNNFAYNITILSVTGEGYPTENEAWEGTTNQLVYTINNWNLDDNGLIVSDEFSLLAVPVKTVKISKDGGESSYSITTFSTLDNPEPLRIKSQLFEPADGNITARISNGNLVIDAEPMNTGQERRTGIITISYAGLETSVNVIQTASGEVYLEVTLDEDWKEFLPPTANAMSEYIYVNASGPWTARLYGSSNFAFQNTLGEYVTRISSVEYTNNRFHVYTSAANGEITETKKGFVLVSLDSDPENYIAVVIVNQGSRGGIKTNPIGLNEIRFYGSQNLETKTGNLETDPILNLTRFTFSIESSGTVVQSNIKLSGKDYDKFDFSFDAVTKRITVWAKEKNSSSNPCTATLSVSDNRNANLLVSLFQGINELTVVADTISVPAKGGNSNPIKISIEDPAITWRATIETRTNGSRAIFNHKAKLMVVDGGGELGSASTNKNLYVEFPKVYFPNRETKIKAVVTVTPSTGGGASKTVEVYQKALVAKTMDKNSIWNLRYWNNADCYGALESSWFTDYTTALNNLLPGSGAPGSKWTSVLNTPTTGNVYPAGTNYIHLGNRFYYYTPFNWEPVENFRTSEDGIIVLTGDDETTQSIAVMNNYLPNLGFTGLAAGEDRSFRLANSITTNRIGMFLTTKGKNQIASPNITNFHNNSIHTYIASIPSTAVPLVTNSTYSNRIYMAIDPAQKVVYIGECEIFDSVGDSNDQRNKFMNNFIQYVLYSAKYGSHFNDMFRLDEDYPTKIPAMWDDVWETNKWPDYAD